jgi:hypothetical protein
VFGNSLVNVIVVRGGSTLMQPWPSRCTQYHQLLELSMAAFHARETLVGVLAVIRRLVGAFGGVRSLGARPAEAAAM